MKRILLIMPYGSVGGMERLALTFYNQYKKKGYTVVALKLIKLESDIINFDGDEYYLSDKDFGQLSMFQRVFFYLTAPFKIARIIRHNKITHSISFGDMSNIFSSLSFSKEYKIASIHALKSVELSDQTTFNKIVRLSYRTSYSKFNKVVCISRAIKEDLIEKCNFKFKKTLKIIYNPHNISQIQKRATENVDDPTEKGIFLGKTILFLGRLSVQKSPWHLINAFSLIAKKYSEVNLVFIGDGNQNVINFLKKQIDRYDLGKRVFFLGRKSNPYKYLSKANLLALSSHYEGTPNVIVESIALNTPIVSSHCTDGVVELMSLKDYAPSNNNLEVESGIITPNLFQGRLGIPNEISLSKEEEKFAKALSLILESSKYAKKLEEYQDRLLEKFEVERISENYLL